MGCSNHPSRRLTHLGSLGRARLQSGSPQGAGLTLVELLVVLAIIAVLVGMVLVGVHQTRARSDELVCSDRMRQIGLALVSYESARRALCPANLGHGEVVDFDASLDPPSPSYWKRAQFTSSFALMAPFLELSPLVETLDPILLDASIGIDQSDAIHGVAFFDLPGYWSVAERQPSILTCPADGRPNPLVKVGGGFQSARRGVMTRDVIGAYVNLSLRSRGAVGYASYAACVGAHSGGSRNHPEFDRYDGAMAMRQGRPMRHIKDGATSTIVFGEVTWGVFESYEEAPIHRQSWLSGGVARMRGKVPWMTVPPSDHGLFGTPVEATLAGFGSPHPRGVYFAFLDGHVEAISRSADWRVLYGLAGIADGGSL